RIESKIQTGHTVIFGERRSRSLKERRNLHGQELSDVHFRNSIIDEGGLKREPSYQAEIATVGSAHGGFADCGKGANEILTVAGEFVEVWFHEALTIAWILCSVNRGGSSTISFEWMRPERCASPKKGGPPAKRIGEL